MTGKKYLFISGAPRSGTTALTRLFNTVPNVHIGMEFFKKAPNPAAGDYLGPGMFSAAEIASVLAGRPQPFIDGQIARFGDAEIIGDKHPHYHRVFDRMAVFPSVLNVFIYRAPRDVAKSFDAWYRIPDNNWNLPGYMGLRYFMQAGKNLIEAQRKAPQAYLVVRFEKLFLDGAAGKAYFHRVLEKVSAWSPTAAPDEGMIDRILANSAKKRKENAWSADYSLDPETVRQYAQHYKRDAQDVAQEAERIARDLDSMEGRILA